MRAVLIVLAIVVAWGAPARAGGTAQFLAQVAVQYGIPRAPAPLPYTGYAPPPPVGPGAGTEQPPVVDTAGANGATVDRCSEPTNNALAMAMIPVELALCALSRQWKSEPLADPAAPASSPAAASAPSRFPAATFEVDPAVR